MDCRNLERNELVEKYLNGQLDPAAQDDFEVHILECPRCLELLDTLQTVRFDLAERAPELRTQTTVRRSWFRWQWVTVACTILIVGGLGLQQYRKIRKKNQEIVALQTGQKSMVPPSTALQTAGAPPEPIPSSSNNGRDYLAFKGSRVRSNSLPVSAHTGPKRAANPQSGTGSENAPPQSADENKTEIATIPPQPANQTNFSAQKPTANINKGNDTPGLLSNQGEKELFRLATVQAPPYTFPGFTRYAKENASAVQPEGARPGQVKSLQGKRPAFESAMLAYVDGNYDRAAELLERAFKQETPAQDTDFYLGICWLIQGNAQDSIAPLKAALTFSQSPLTQSAHSYLAKAYLQVRDFAAAESELQSAASMTGSLTTSAKQDLAALQKLRAAEAK